MAWMGSISMRSRARLTADSRRRVLQNLAALPVLGGLAGILAPDGTAAKRRKKRKRKKEKKCKAKPITQTCSGKCGSVKNTCRKTVDCGSCNCAPTCGICRTCESGPNAPGQCVVDARQVGDPCGSVGKTCQPDGACVCVPDPPAAVCGDQTCGTAIDTCGQEIACTGCAGCCDGNVCHIDDNVACGSNGGACANCLDSDSLCHDGTCQTCDVLCAPGDAGACGDALQAKLDTGGPATVLVCAGLYQGNFSISRGVTVIGAGQEDDESAATILDGNNAGPGVTIADGTTATVELENLRLSNGTSGPGGGGIRHRGTLLRLRNSMVTNNSASGGSGGGINVASGSTLEAEGCTIRENQVGGINDGGGVIVYGTATLTDCLVEENSAANYGGGIYVMQNATATLAGKTAVRDNVGGEGVFVHSPATISVAPGVLVCGNSPFQCSGFSDAACLDVCPI